MSNWQQQLQQIKASGELKARQAPFSLLSFIHILFSDWLTDVSYHSPPDEERVNANLVKFGEHWTSNLFRFQLEKFNKCISAVVLLMKLNTYTDSGGGEWQRIPSPPSTHRGTVGKLMIWLKWKSLKWIKVRWISANCCPSNRRISGMLIGETLLFGAVDSVREFP